MNILILPTTYPNIYNQNASIFVQDQAKALVNAGVDVDVVGAIPISFKDIFNKKLFRFGSFVSEKDKINVHIFLFPSIPKLRVFNQFIRGLLNRWLLKKHLKSNRVDVIHVHNSTAGEMALWAKEKYNIPFVVTEHSTAFARNILSKNEIQKYKKIYEVSCTNIAVSREFCVLLEKIYRVEFRYIPNVVDTQYFNKVKKVKKEFTFINIGYLEKKKNQILLINSFSKAFKDSKNIKLFIVGGGLEYDNLQKEIDKLNMQKQIKLFGFATRKEVLDKLQDSDAFVLSSKYETFGVVLIEAMSCGLPTISTKCGGPESIITDDRLGMLIENEDDLSEAMQKVYQNYKDYDCNFIRNYAIENFSQKAVSKKLIDIYKEIVNAQN